MTRILLALSLLLVFVSGAFAQSGTTKPKSTLDSEIGQQLPNNMGGLIQPSNVRQVFVDVVASAQQAPGVNAQTGTSYTVLASDFGNLVTLDNAGAVTLTLPQPTGTLINFNVYAADIGAGNVTVSATGATINGAPTVTLPSGSYMWFVSDGSGTNYAMVQNGTTPAANSILPSMLANSAVPYGTPMLNGTLVASVGSNNLTIAVKTLAGSDPAAGDPTWFLIPNGAGGYTPIELTSALSITVPSGEAAGTVSGQTSRLWVGVFNNGGTAALGVYNSLNASGPSILAWDETSQPSTTAVASCASAQAWCTSSALSGKNFRVIGFVESTQTTAGTWAAAPTKVQLFGPGVKKPGETFGPVANNFNTNPSTTSSTYVPLTGASVTINVSSRANLIEIFAAGPLAGTSGGATGALILSRGTTPSANLIGNAAVNITTSVAVTATASLLGYDLPNTAGNVTYAVQGKTNAGTLTFGGPSQISAKEIQI